MRSDHLTKHARRHPEFHPDMLHRTEGYVGRRQITSQIHMNSNQPMISPEYQDSNHGHSEQPITSQQMKGDSVGQPNKKYINHSLPPDGATRHHSAYDLQYHKSDHDLVHHQDVSDLGHHHSGGEPTSFVTNLDHFDLSGQRSRSLSRTPSPIVIVPLTD